MKNFASFLLYIPIALLLFPSCAQLREMDRERLNHPSMDLSAFENKKGLAPLTQLSGVEAGGAAAGCSVCAH